MRLNYINIFSLICGFALIACEPEIDNIPSASKGEADFSTYVAVGNSLTAGLSDGGLYREGQENSFPAILAMQFKELGGGEFNQPLLPEGNGSGYRTLTGLNPDGTPIMEVLPPDPNFTNKVEGDVHNLGIPGIRVLDITVQGYGSSPEEGKNPYFYRITPEDNPFKTYLEVVAESDPTFFTNWIGNNDVLGYATSGGAYGINGMPGTFINGITPANFFQGNYDALMNALTANEAKGVVATIPSVTLTPFFTTVPKQIIPLTSQEQVDQLNAAYAQYNMGVEMWNEVAAEEDKLSKIIFKLGANYPVVADKDIPDASGLPKFSQLTADGALLLTLPTNQIASEGWGTLLPMPDEYSLTATEIQNIKNATDSFNQIIRSYENENIVVFETDELLLEVQKGLIIDGINFDNRFILGNVFSLDGIHLTPAGYAIVANKMASLINNKFGSTLSGVSITNYRGVTLP